MAQKSNLTIEVLSIIGGVLTAIFFLGISCTFLHSPVRNILPDCRKYPDHYYFICQSPPDQTFSGCDEYYMLHSRMYISRLWNE